MISNSFHIVPNIYEKNAWKSNDIVCGIDEAGRGCLAGPLVAAAAILKPNCTFELLKDSKILSENEREKAYNWLRYNAYFAVSILDSRNIDKHNIYQATIRTMKRALIQLLSTISRKPKYILIDSIPLKIKNFDIPINFFNKGETYSISIAAASIVAKVTRDKIMDRINTLFPNFGFNEHKGYGTKTHQDILTKLGTCIIHRKSFLSNHEFKKEISYAQSSIC